MCDYFIVLSNSKCCTPLLTIFCIKYLWKVACYGRVDGAAESGIRNYSFIFQPPVTHVFVGAQ